MSGVAGRYAGALFEAASDAGAMDTVGADLGRFKAMIGESSDLANVIASPVFTAEQQVAAVTALLGRVQIAGLAANFIKLVASKRRLFALPGMIDSYLALVADAKGIVGAQVTLAETPSARQLDDIRAALNDVAGKQVAVDVTVDPAIIGGLIVKMGSRMVDASLKTKLNSIRLAMKEVG
jgi:F-type H+-transporting ATPase subunit delta